METFLTLADIVNLLIGEGQTKDEAQESVGRAFRSRVLHATPSFTFPYAEAEINWTDGSVRIQRPIRKEFVPGFDMGDVTRVFSIKERDEIMPMPIYQPPYLKILLKAIEAHNITLDHQPKAEVLREWFMAQEVGGERISENIAKSMTTIIRLPERKRGGAVPSKKTNK